MGIHVVGALPRREDGTLDPDRLRIPLRGRGGDVAAWCLAVPYLRPADLPMGSPTGGDPLIDAVRSIYRDAVELATAQRKPDQALLLTGHLYMVGGQLSELSERKILGGNEHALPLDVFEGAVTYVALGHLHRAQAVGGRAQVRYSGAPLPLSMDEATYPHQVVEITLDAGRIAAVEALPVPRTVEIIRIPAAGAARLDAALPALIGLQLDAALPPWRWPYLEVRLLLDKPEPGLRRLVEQLLADRPVRLLKIGVEHRQNSREPGPGQPPPLSELAPDEVFRRLWRKTHEGEPSPELLEAFHALVESVQAGGAA
jgi:exonuclease SbcD